MFFHVTRDGRPVRKRRYVFTETFAVAALAAYARATGDEQASREAVDLFKLIARYQILPKAKCWTSPVLANGKIYARTNKPGEIGCVDVSGK